MTVDVVVGGFWGDEGKGKIISHLVNKRKAIIVAKGGVGPNAGHTIVVKGKEYKLRHNRWICSPRWKNRHADVG